MSGGAAVLEKPAINNNGKKPTRRWNEMTSEIADGGRIKIAGNFTDYTQARRAQNLLSKFLAGCRGLKIREHTLGQNPKLTRENFPSTGFCQWTIKLAENSRIPTQHELNKALAM